MRYLGFLSFAWLVGFQSPELLADRYFLFDIDGTVLNSRVSQGGSFRSTYRLFREDFRANVLQPVADGPRVIEVDFEELRDLYPHLAKGPNLPGSMNSYELRDGLIIRPGDYRMDLSHSFVHFRTPVEGEDDFGRNYLLEDLIQAIERDAEKWKGPYWNEFAKLVETHPDSVGIITSRGQVESDWKDFFEHLISRGDLSRSPNLRHLHNISLRSYDTLNLQGNVAVQKAELLRKFIKGLSRKRPSSSDLVLDLDGKSRQALHTIVFVEDSQSVLDHVYKALSEVVSSRVAEVKVVLVNAGTDREVQQSGRPRAIVISSNGKFREAQPEEISGEVYAEAKPVTASDCRRLIQGFKD